MSRRRAWQLPVQRPTRETGPPHAARTKNRGAEPSFARGEAVARQGCPASQHMEPAAKPPATGGEVARGTPRRLRGNIRRPCPSLPARHEHYQRLRRLRFVDLLLSTDGWRYGLLTLTVLPGKVKINRRPPLRYDARALPCVVGVLLDGVSVSKPIREDQGRQPRHDQERVALAATYREESLSDSR